MQTYYRLLLICSLYLAAANAYATITCSKPNLSKPVAHGSIYNFKAVVTCKLVDETINLNSLKDAYRDEITGPNSQFKVHTQADYDNEKGMVGYQLDATQSYKSEQGALVVRANILILDDSTKHFVFELDSKSVDGQDDSKYYRMIFNKVDLELLPDSAQVIVTEEIDVEAPWYAPLDTFYNKVQKGLTESITKSAIIQAKKIIGENVEALRK